MGRGSDNHGEKQVLGKSFFRFQSLVEREWICAGHPFQLRNAHSAYAEGAITGPYESPVFLCFLDAVYQVGFQDLSYSFSYFLFFFFTLRGCNVLSFASLTS